jgi:hypothetical protein
MGKSDCVMSYTYNYMDKKYRIIGTVPKSNRKNKTAEAEALSIPQQPCTCLLPSLVHALK